MAKQEGPLDYGSEFTRLTAGFEGVLGDWVIGQLRVVVDREEGEKFRHDILEEVTATLLERKLAPDPTRPLPTRDVAALQRAMNRYILKPDAAVRINRHLGISGRNFYMALNAPTDTLHEPTFLEDDEKLVGEIVGVAYGEYPYVPHGVDMYDVYMEGFERYKQYVRIGPLVMLGSAVVGDCNPGEDSAVRYPEVLVPLEDDRFQFHRAYM